ncbi:MAG: nucleotidyltransferase family protein [Clostridiales bacterium]|nr:nucleotidyltransferase family protein [Clostridiales bacterium]
MDALPEPARPVLRREWEAGLTPASLEHCQRAVLYRLRMMRPEDFTTLPDCSEGLEHRLYRAAQQATSLEEFYTLAKTKRYAHARIRRLALWAFLGMTAADRPERLPYVRVLGLNDRGREVLHTTKKNCPVPILTKPAAARRLDEAGQRLFALEQRGTDLWRLCLPGLKHSAAGSGWTTGPVVL